MAISAPTAIPSVAAARLMRLATLCSVLTAAVLVMVKFAAWELTDSLSLLSSLVDSTLDVISSLINFFALRLALKPPDEDHRFGHGKAEDISALGQALFIAASGIYICYEAVNRFITPHAIGHETAGIIVMVLSIVLTSLLIGFQRYVMRRTRSVIIHADSLHYSMDLLTSLAVIAGIAGTAYFGWAWADPLIAFVISIYILREALRLGKEALDHLMDHEFSSEERQRIMEIVKRHPQVVEIHALKTRRSGVQGFIQFHLHLDDSISLREAHNITDAIEAALEAAFPMSDVLIHPEPANHEH